MQQKHEQDIFKTLSSPSRGIYKEKGSKFLSFAFPVSDTDEISKLLDSLRKEYFDARHHCYAYRLGTGGDIWRANDDGEPSYTAGKQILGQLLSKELSDVLIVVVRYFGGIKLGVPGLINAYRSATADAISNGTIVEKIETAIVTISFEYEDTNNISKVLKETKIAPKKFVSDRHCTIIAEVGLSEMENFIDKMTKAGGRATVSSPQIL